MDKKMLSGYRSRVRRIEKLEQDIMELKQRNVQIVAGKVQSSMKDFPYIQCHATVEMDEPIEAARIKNSIQKKEAEIKKLQKMNQEVIEFIDGIEDPNARSVFEYYYTDGKEKQTQKEIADKTGIEDRCRVGKIISEYL